MDVKRNFINQRAGDYISIDRIEAPCHVGITAEERSYPQTLHVSIHLFRNLRPAGSTDDLNQTVDYALVVNLIRDHLASHTFSLVERIAEEIASLILRKFSVERVGIQVEKKPFPGVGPISVNITREKTKVIDSSSPTITSASKN